jgi:hypothetical protein
VQKWRRRNGTERCVRVGSGGLQSSSSLRGSCRHPAYIHPSSTFSAPTHLPLALHRSLSPWRGGPSPRRVFPRVVKEWSGCGQPHLGEEVPVHGVCFQGWSKSGLSVVNPTFERRSQSVASAVVHIPPKSWRASEGGREGGRREITSERENRREGVGEGESMRERLGGWNGWGNGEKGGRK